MSLDNKLIKENNGKYIYINEEKNGEISDRVKEIINQNERKVMETKSLEYEKHTW